MIQRIALHLKRAEALWKLFLKENDHVRVKSPDTGRDVKLVSLKGPQGTVLLNQKYKEWEKSHRENHPEKDVVDHSVYKDVSIYGSDQPLYRGQVEKRLNEIFSDSDRPLKMEHVLDMMGLHHLAETHGGNQMRVIISGGSIMHVKVSHPHIQDMYREIFVKNGKPVIHNMSLCLEDDAPKGLGTKLIANQILQCRKHGISKIECFAADPTHESNNPKHPYVGYKVWPKMGYDGKIPRYVKNRLPPEYKDYQKVSDFYQTPDGVSWWEENGRGFNAELDLTEGSHSRRVLEAYISKKAEKEKRTPEEWIKSANKIALYLRQSEDLYQTFLKEHKDTRVKNPDTGNQVKLVSLKGDKGADLLQKMYQEWAKSHKETPIDKPSPYKSIKPKISDPEKFQNIVGQLSKSLQKPITTDHLLDMIGLDHLLTHHPEKTQVKFLPTSDRTVTCYVTHPMVEEYERTFICESDGSITIFNNALVMKPNTPKGLGTKIFSNQVNQAKSQGVSRITCHAAGSSSSKKYVGYKVWPKLGYDGVADTAAPIPPDLRSKMGLDQEAPVKVSDFYRVDGGTEWWEQNGRGFGATFDLSEGSLSMKILSEYVAKKAEKDGKKPEDWVKSAMRAKAIRLLTF